MKQFLITTWLGLAGWGLAFGQSESRLTREGDYWVRTMQGAIDSSSDRLRVQTAGNVNVRGAALSQGNYTLKIRLKVADERQAAAMLDRIHVKTGTEGGWAYLMVTPPRLVASGMELTVNGPRGMRQVLAETSGGTVQGSDWDGDFEARSAGGPIQANRIRGRGELRTAGGPIDVGSVGGALRCSSGGGDIRVNSAGGAAALETAGGDIFIHQAEGSVQASTGGGNIRIERAGGTVVARTAGGLIQVQQAGGPVTAESSGGAIQVNSATGVRCESAGGAIRLRNISGPVRAFANSGSILAELASMSDGSGHGLADSILSTNAGDITVLIPSNLALTIRASNESSGSGRIRSDFPQLRPRTGGLPDVGPLVAQGELNGGGPMLRVNVEGGTIYLRRAK